MPDEEWAVRVFDADHPSGGGSGFLVDAQRVLTCAHVVDGMRNSMVRFTARPDVGDVPVTNMALPPRWHEGAVGPRGIRRGDVALLTLSRPVNIAPARFASKNSLHSEVDGLRILGFPAGAGDVGKIATATAPAPRVLQGGEWVQLDNASDFGPDIAKGYSGGPVLIFPSMEVVGMVVVADRSDRTGFMLPLAKLLEYREELADLVPLGPFSPVAHRALRGVLAGVELEDPRRAFRRAIADDPLAELVDADITLVGGSAYAIARHIAEGLFVDESRLDVAAAVGRLCSHVAAETDADRRKEIHDWIHGYLGVAAPATIAAPHRSTYRLSVRLGRSAAEASAMLLSMVLERADSTSEVVYEDRVSGSRVRRKVENLLQQVIDTHVPADAELLVEFVLPRSWLTKPVDEWRLGGSVVQVGWRYPVVVRDRARLERATADRELSRRWDKITTRADQTKVVWWIRCHDRITAKQLAAALAVNERTGLLALCNPPVPPAKHPALVAAFDSGIPVLLWRRVRCEHESPDGVELCDGGRFRKDIATILAELLARGAFQELLERVRWLRAEAGQAGEAEPHLGRGLTLVWDPPVDRPIRLAIADRE